MIHEDTLSVCFNIKNKHFGDEDKGSFRKRCNDERYRAEVVEVFSFVARGRSVGLHAI
jgi:hypothetical protein